MPSARLLRQGSGWRAAGSLCAAGPRDPVFEERHDDYSIAAVIQGSFRYRSETGTALLYPGALMLGNHGSCYECGHDHGRGDRCVAFHIAPEVFHEVASTLAGSSRFRFPVGALPALPRLAPRLARARAGLASASSGAADEFVIDLVEAVIGACSGSAPAAQRVSAIDSRRIGEAAEFIASHAQEPLDLEQLAGRASMSKYHFLRVFRRVLGVTPHQFLLETRIRRAAERLLSSAEPVATIAYDAGFGDLSTFNARFRRQFGRSPSAYRSGARAFSGR